MIIGNQEEYEVEAILNKQTQNRRTEYLAKWLGYPVHESSWEPLQNLDNSKEFILQFEKNLEKTQRNETSNSLALSRRTRYRPPLGRRNKGRPK